jgi:hypothetical protein
MFRRSGDGWVAEHTVKQTTAQRESYFGMGLTGVSGNAFGVGAYYASGCNGDSPPSTQGAAYLVHQEPDGWKEDCVEPESGSGKLLFGFGIGLLDRRLVVGAPWDSRVPMGSTNGVTPGAGSSYVYERTSFPLSGQSFRAPDPRWSAFGSAVAMAPGYLVIGAGDEFDPPRPKDLPYPVKGDPEPDGAAYLYALDH